MPIISGYSPSHFHNTPPAIINGENLTQVSTTKTHKYDVIGLVSATKTHKYDVIGLVTATKTHKFHTIVAIGVFFS